MHLVVQVTELATANLANRRNKDTEDLHKMGTTKQSSAEIEKGKRLCFRCGENGMRDVYSVQHGEKLVLIVKRKIIFRDRALFLKWTGCVRSANH